MKSRLQNPLVMSYIREDWICQQMRNAQKEFTDIHSMQILCGTWNVNAKKPIPVSASAQLLNWFFPPSEQQATGFDVVAIGFQEIVDLNAVNVVGVNNLSQQRSNQWEETIAQLLNHSAASNSYYKLILQKHLVGILLLVFVKEQHIPYVKDVDGATAGVGIMGMMGNKGGCSIRMKFYNSSLCFVCSHLAAHRENVTGRNSDVSNILVKSAFHEDDLSSSSFQDDFNSSNASGGSRNRSQSNGRYSGTSSGSNSTMNSSLSSNISSSSVYGILDHEFVFWLGDLNYRITEDISIEHCFKLLVDDLDFLSAHDQLTIERSHGRVFEGFEEGKLKFRPTYKFQPNTNLYERRPDKKTRAPAWCDRILWRSAYSQDNVKQLYYGSVDEPNLSDHKPVSALFEVKVKYEVEEKRMKVMRRVMQQLDKWENDNMPKVSIENSVLSFGAVKYMVPVSQFLTIENTGQVVAQYRFIPKLEEKQICKSWLHVMPSYGMVPPGEKQSIQIRVLVSQNIGEQLSAGKETLDDTMILRIENGRDYFVIVSGTYQPSCFATSLAKLVLIRQPIRQHVESSSSHFGIRKSDIPNDHQQPVEIQPPSPTSSSTPMEMQKIPKELWRIVDDLYSHSLKEKDLFSQSGNAAELPLLREALDTGEVFPDHSAYSMAEILLCWLQSLPESVIPENILMKSIQTTRNMHARNNTDRNESLKIQLNSRSLLDGLSPVHYNTFLYIISFLRECLKHSAANKLTPEKLAFTFSRCLMDFEENSYSDLTTIVEKIVYYLLTTSTL